MVRSMDITKGLAVNSPWKHSGLLLSPSTAETFTPPSSTPISFPPFYSIRRVLVRGIFGPARCFHPVLSVFRLYQDILRVAADANHNFCHTGAAPYIQPLSFPPVEGVTGQISH
jgi:hypothetical protein